MHCANWQSMVTGGVLRRRSRFVYRATISMSKIKFGRWVLAFLLGSVSSLLHAAPPAVPEVLLQPGAVAAHPEKGFLLSIVKTGERLVAVGEGGRIILSDDLGKSWRQANVPVNVLLTQVRFATPTEGWAIGHLGVVLHTADGGETWQLQLDGIKAARILLEEAQRNVAQRGEQDEQASKALSQAQYLLEDGPDKPFLTLLLNGGHLSVLGAFGLALQSNDGGKTWSPLAMEAFNPGALHFYASTNQQALSLVVGEQGLLLRGEGGRHYQRVEQPYSGTLFGVLATPDIALAYGLRGNAVKSFDRGATWQEINTGVSASLQGGLSLVDGRLVLLAENGQVVLGDKHGEHFNVLNRQILPAVDAVQVSANDLVLVGPVGVQTLSLAVGESAQ